MSSSEKGQNGSEIDLPPKVANSGHSPERVALEKKLLRKVDLRMSILIIIYILNYVRLAARKRGLETDLHLQNQEFPTLLSILYVGYIIMQIPSNLFLNWMGKPSLYLPAAMIIWGTISCLTGITTNFVGALLTRFFLGFVEAAFFPGALFLISKWYKRDEIGLRTAILYCGNIISNAFGALMASGILANMEGKLGHAAWRWLFYIEGALTVFIAVCAIFILPDFPATSKFLTPEERELALLRMTEDAGVGDQDETENHGQFGGLRMAFFDWRVWWLAFAMTAQVVALSFNAFFPTLTQTLGYSPTVTLLLCAPPFAFAALAAFVLSRYVGERCFHMISSFGLGILGFIIAVSTMNTAARYVSLFLMAQSYAGFVVMYAWVSNSFPRPPSKRAVALALINCWSQLGNVAGSYVWPSAWGPTYRNSYAICIACAGVNIVMCLVFRQTLVGMNKKLEEEEAAKDVKTPGFRYMFLNYLSRQFDALASAKTPPSTPTDEHESYKFTRSRRATGSESSSLPRVQTWSTKSFLLPAKSPSSPSRARPKHFIALSELASLPQQQLSSGAFGTASTSSEPPAALVVSRLEAILHRTFIVRVILLAWNTLRAAWTSVSGRTLEPSTRGNASTPVDRVVVEKDISDDETLNERSNASTSTERSSFNPNRPLYMASTRSGADAPIPYDSTSSDSLPPSSKTDSVPSASRSSTPITSATRKTPFHLPKTLVLDLDETLIHSTSRPMSMSTSSGFFGLGSFNTNKGSGHMVEVVLGGHSTLYHVYKRPFVDFFLRTVSGWYTLVIFTASMQEYADPIIDWLDAGRGILAQRFFRDSCTQLPNGSFTKDLSVIDPDLSRVCVIDNSPISYRINEANGIPIEGWTHDPSDEALLDLLPVLDSLRFTSDVRRVLGLRTAGGISS
ncbi:major facilitator superfamily domain-containing protein [Favolaschia claudopus]|uniref:Major facilitator superfamily domain-containing protein n=1 Tax=Favolaschia claudopus TaxID=2862362 RepID=A0AAW0E863_9AGAR